MYISSLMTKKIFLCFLRFCFTERICIQKIFFYIISPLMTEQAISLLFVFLLY
jgi:hypothetical protein